MLNRSIFELENDKRNLQFINSFYTKPRWKDGKMVVPDCLGVVYKDEATGKKYLDLQYEPRMEFYLAYEDVDIPHHLRHISKDLVEKCSCKFHDLPLTLAKTAGDDMVQDYYETIKKSPYKAKKKYHYLPYVFNSDMDIEDFWIGKFLDKYNSEKDHLTKGYYDIEVDGIDYPSFPDENEAPCPINAITYVNDEYMTCHTYLLREKNNPLIQQEENGVEDLKQHLRETLRDDFEYHLYWFDSELKMIISFFDQVNTDKPDFMMA